MKICVPIGYIMHLGGTTLFQNVFSHLNTTQAYYSVPLLHMLDVGKILSNGDMVGVCNGHTYQ